MLRKTAQYDMNIAQELKLESYLTNFCDAKMYEEKLLLKKYNTMLN